MSRRHQPSDSGQQQQPAESLEKLYLRYFSPPAEECTGVFEQVTVFDYSIVSYCSDSTQERGKPSAELE
jgi:hypothetical protein